MNRRKPRPNTNPLRKVTTASLHEGVVTFNMRGGNLRSRWWELTLECGHTTERSARYPKGASEGRQGWSRLRHQPPYELVLPAPQRVRCGSCAHGVAGGQERST